MVSYFVQAFVYVFVLSSWLVVWHVISGPVELRCVCSQDQNQEIKYYFALNQAIKML